MAAASFVGAIDQGTTSTRFLLYDRNANVVSSHQVEFTQIHPNAGWVEHDPMEILETVRICMERVFQIFFNSGHNSLSDLKAIGITNQRETCLVWSKTTGLPLHNAIVWMDSRTSDICKRLEKEFPGGRDHFRSVCGLPLSTYFSAVKLIWLRENVPSVRDAIESGDALFGTIDTWLIWNLTVHVFEPATLYSFYSLREDISREDVQKGGIGGIDVGSKSHVYVTDCTNASRTMLMDLKTLQWHEPTLQLLGISQDILPRIISNSEIIGRIADSWPMGGTLIASSLGDQHAAMVGQKCKIAEAKSTYGTGCFIMMNTGAQLCSSNHGLLSTVAFRLGNNATINYALEGSIAIAGAAVQWLRDALGVIERTSQVEGLASSVQNSGGVYFVPAFGGLLAPRWKEDARGVLVGISRYTSRAHIARAVLESICFQAREVLTAMLSDVKSNSFNVGSQFVLRVDGGASVNNLLMQIQADFLGAPVIRPADVETTARGAALAAGLGIGLWTMDDIFATTDMESEDGKLFSPLLNEQEKEARYLSWCKAVERSYGLADLV